MRTRNLIFGSGRSVVAGTEFVFPMLVGCGVQELMIGSIHVDEHGLGQTSFLGQAHAIDRQAWNTSTLLQVSIELVSSSQIVPHARALIKVQSHLERHIVSHKTTSI